MYCITGKEREKKERNQVIMQNKHNKNPLVVEELPDKVLSF